MTYGLEAGADIQATNIRMCNLGATFDVQINTSSPVIAAKNLGWDLLKDVYLPLYGMHNVQNALVVVALAIELDYAAETIVQALSKFGGVKRRFTRVGDVAGVAIIDDYAHHPVEIEAVLKAARYATTEEIVAVVQVHRYTRLSHLFDEFVHVLHLADRLVICPIYSAGEAPIEGMNEDTFTQALRYAYPQKSIHQVSGEQALTAYLADLFVPHGALHSLNPGSMIVCMGAGSISQWANNLPMALSGLITSLEKAHVAH